MLLQLLRLRQASKNKENLVKKLVSALAVFAAAQFAFADAHIFNYHRFDDDRHPSTNISSKNLREQFDYFKEKGYEVIPLLREYIKDGILQAKEDDEGYFSDWEQRKYLAPNKAEESEAPSEDKE